MNKEAKKYDMMLKSIRNYPIITNAFIILSYFGSIYGFYDKIIVFYVVFGQSFYLIYHLIVCGRFFKMCSWYYVLLFNMFIALLNETLYVFKSPLNISNKNILIVLSIFAFIALLLAIKTYLNGKKIKRNSCKSTKRTN